VLPRSRRIPASRSIAEMLAQALDVLRPGARWCYRPGWRAGGCDRKAALIEEHNAVPPGASDRRSGASPCRLPLLARRARTTPACHADCRIPRSRSRAGPRPATCHCRTARARGTACAARCRACPLSGSAGGQRCWSVFRRVLLARVFSRGLMSSSPSDPAAGRR